MNDTRRPMTLEEALGILNPTPIEVVEELMWDLVSDLSVPGVLPLHVFMRGRNRPDRPDLRQVLILDAARGFGLSIVAGTGIPSSELGLFETAELWRAPEGECHELPIRVGGAWWIVDSDSVRPEQTVEMIVERLAAGGERRLSPLPNGSDKRRSLTRSRGRLREIRRTHGRRLCGTLDDSGYALVGTAVGTGSETLSTAQ